MGYTMIFFCVNPVKWGDERIIFKSVAKVGGRLWGGGVEGPRGRTLRIFMILGTLLKLFVLRFFTCKVSTGLTEITDIKYLKQYIAPSQFSINVHDYDCNFGVSFRPYLHGRGSW